MECRILRKTIAFCARGVGESRVLYEGAWNAEWSRKLEHSALEPSWSHAASMRVRGVEGVDEKERRSGRKKRRPHKDDD